MIDQIISQIHKMISLDTAAIGLIKESFLEKTVEAKAHLLRSGELCDFEGVITKGIMRNYYKSGEDERITHFSKEGNWVSDYASFTNNEISQLNIQAIEETTLLILSSDQLDVLSASIPQWDKLGKIFFENQFIEKEKEIQLRISKSPEERYIQLLKEQAPLLQRIPQHMIAQYIGIKAESLSRMRKRLSKNGIS